MSTVNDAPHRHEAAPSPARAADRFSFAFWLGCALLVAGLMLADLVLWSFRH
jgi:hypothetical protein